MKTKMMIILGAFLCLMFIAVFVYYVGSKLGKKPQLQEETQAPYVSPTIQTQDKSKASITPSIPIPQEFTGTKSVGAYTVIVPENFIGKLQANSGGGSTLTIKLSETSDLPSISIQETSSSLSSLERQKQVFVSLGYVESPIIVNGIEARKYAGSLPLENGKLFEITVVLEYRGKVYQASIRYAGASRNDQYEQLFYEVVSTLKFH